MRPMVVKVGPEIEQLVFEICLSSRTKCDPNTPVERCRLAFPRTDEHECSTTPHGDVEIVEHPTKCGTIDRSRMDVEANDPARVLIHDHQGLVGPQRSRFAPEQIHAPEAVFRAPGKSTRKDHQSPVSTKT
jgi:hypothetical protein